MRLYEESAAINILTLFSLNAQASMATGAIFVMYSENYKEGMAVKEVEEKSWLFFICNENRTPYCKFEAVVNGKYKIEAHRVRLSSPQFSCKIYEKTDFDMWKTVHYTFTNQDKSDQSDSDKYVCGYVSWLTGGGR